MVRQIYGVIKMYSDHFLYNSTYVCIHLNVYEDMPGPHAMVMLTKDEVDLQSLLSALPPTQTHTLPLHSLPCAFLHLIILTVILLSNL